MGYKYEDFKEWLASREGQRLVIKVALKISEWRADVYHERKNTIGTAMQGLLGDSWEQLAAIDHLAALGLISIDRRIDKPTQEHMVVWRGF